MAAGDDKLVSILEGLKERRPEKSDPPADPVLADPFEAIEALTERDKAFVRMYLQTADLDAACEAGQFKPVGISGKPGHLTGPRKLADPTIARIIVGCAPFVGDSKHAMKLVAPYMLHRLSQVAMTGSDAQSVQAIRDALVIAGEGRDRDAKDVASLIRQMRAERDRLRKTKDSEAATTKPSLPKPKVN